MTYRRETGKQAIADLASTFIPFKFFQKLLTTLFCCIVHWYTFAQMLNCLFSRLPFNWKTPFGYLAFLFCASSSLLSILYCMLPIACFTVGTFFLVTSFIKDIAKNDFLNLSYEISNDIHFGMKEQLCNFMQSFSEIKQLS